MTVGLGRPPERDPSDLVPSGEYRHDPLAEDVRQWLDRRSELLADAYHYDHNVEESAESYQDVKENVFTGSRFKWYGKGSERTVASLGRTSQGKPIRGGHFGGVIVKFTPWLRVPDDDERTVTTVVESGNLHELAVWAYAVDHGDEDLFAPILDYSDDGDWLAMAKMIPVYRARWPRFASRTIDCINERQADVRLCDLIAERALDRGFDPHTKDGNVGYDPHEGEPRIIDYGAHVGIDAMEDSHELTEYAAEA